MNFTLPETISSSEDLMTLSLEVSSYAQWFNQFVIANKAGTKYQAAQPELSVVASDIIRDWAKQEQLTTARLDELIEILETIKSRAKTMTITLAAPATAELKKALVSWARDNISPDVLISFRFNATILGGMVVRFGSHVFDWSFRRVIMSERHKIPEILNRV